MLNSNRNICLLVLINDSLQIFCYWRHILSCKIAIDNNIILWNALIHIFLLLLCIFELCDIFSYFCVAIKLFECYRNIVDIICFRFTTKLGQFLYQQLSWLIFLEQVLFCFWFVIFWQKMKLTYPKMMSNSRQNSN